MPRSVLLFTGPWADLPLEEVANRASDWGYQGLELCCWGDHLEVQRALSDKDYCQRKLDLLARYDLTVPVLSNHRVGQAVADPIDDRHQALLPDYVWGDGQPEGVRQRAAEEMMATIRVAQQMGVGVVAGFTGSPLWSYVVGYPAPSADVVAAGFADFARRWHPILDVCRDCGVRFAFEVHPGQIAFDLYSAERALDALDGREEFGFLFDPSHFHWQGIDPVEFLRRFPQRIYHVHIKDVILNLNGRNGLLGSYLPSGDPRRGWDVRSPGRGGIDWEAIIRGLNEIGYDGPLSVEWRDPGMNRDFGAEEACRFVKRLDFEPAARPGSDRAFREA
ncbi:MAG: sugar phosphate isomerase/epimerase [Gemmataceae bacterium]|nr:sugar phosphate isomerase/epimerase [Gemmataceae bacterium]MDW8264090.1 sugar phosphate isomerase/epimerase [Gemmataceae bacterium]